MQSWYRFGKMVMVVGIGLILGSFFQQSPPVSLAIGATPPGEKVSLVSHPKFHPAMGEYLQSLGSAEPASIIVYLTDQPDIKALDKALRNANATRQLRHETVVSTLRAAAFRSQPPLLDYLEQQKSDGFIVGYTPYWIVNAVVVLAPVDQLAGIVSRPEVDWVEPNFKPELIPDPPGKGRRYVPTIAGIGVTPGLRAIRADSCWAAGITGAGRIVGNMDTGVDDGHPALGSRWRGNFAPAAHCWRDQVFFSPTPDDFNGHGTHTMGTITGMNSATGDTVGVAFGALWIADRSIDQGTGPGFDNDVFGAFQWFADPDTNPATIDDVPDVVSNSWGIDARFPGYLDCDNRWQAAIDNCEAAGVVVVFAAGNEGPGPQTLRSPANYALDSVTNYSVGAVDATNFGWPYPIASFSSRGPSDCDGVSIKPEVSSPGVDVYSSVPGGGYALYSGTSMATPHVAGVVALMRQANPNLDVAMVKTILMNTARDEGTPGEDNTYGHGFIDAWAAVQQALALLGPQPRIQVVPESLIVSATEGETTTTTFSIIDTGSVALSFLIDDPEPWLSEAPDSMTIAPADTETITVTVDASLLLPGNHQTSIRIRSSDPFRRVLLLPIRVHVGPDPDITTSPDSFSVVIVAGDSTDTTMTIGNVGLGTLTFHAPVRYKAPQLASAFVEVNPTLRQPLAYSEDLGRMATLPVPASVPPNKPNQPLTGTLNILWDDSHDADGDDLFGNYSELYNQLTLQGINVVQLSTGPITPAVLVGYQILVIVDPENTIDPSEATAIQNFVASGNGLWVIGERAPAFNQATVNNLIAPYNVQFTGDNTTDFAITNFVPHPVTMGIDSLGVDYLGELTVAPPGLALGFDSFSQPVLAAAIAGGKIVFITDSNPMDNFHIGQGDNRRLIDNILGLSGFLSFPTGWLIVTPDTGTVSPSASTSPTVIFNARDLLGGEHFADILVISNDPDEDTVAIPVHLRIAGPEIVVTPETLQVDGIEGDSTSTQLKIANIGEAFLTFAASTVTPWLSIEPPDTGTVLSGDSTFLTIHVDSRALIPGNYQGTIALSTNDFDESDLQIPVLLQVGPNPDIRAVPDSFNIVLFAGDSTSRDLVIHNDSLGTLRVLLSAEMDSSTGLATGLVAEVQVVGDDAEPSSRNYPKNYKNFVETKGGSDPRRGISPILGQGGPDLFGYRWVDSDEPGGPTFSWFDISGIGTPIFGLGDDVNVPGLPLGFTFNYYGTDFTTVNMCTNGWLSFTSTSTQYSNTPLPNALAPLNMVAPFWDDLDFNLGGAAYYYSDGNRFILQYQDVPHYGGGGPYTFQVILYNNGQILFQYLNMNPPADNATIGIQNASGTDGLEVVFNAPYVHNNLAILISKGRDWLSVSPDSARIASGDSVTASVQFNAASLQGGEFFGKIRLVSNDPDEGNITVPAHLRIAGPEIVISPETLVVSGTEGDSTSVQLKIANIGEAPLNWSESVNVSWLAVDPDSGTIATNDSVLLHVLVDSRTLLPGNYRGDITIVSNDFDEGTSVVPVFLHVGPDPCIVVSPDSFFVIVPAGDSLRDSLLIGDTCAGTLWFKITPTAKFITGLASRIGDLPIQPPPKGMTTDPAPVNATGLNDNYHPARAPQRVALFQDSDPWGSTRLRDMLALHGIAYDIFGTGSIGVVDLSPYDKVFVVSNQSSAFYDALSLNRTWFENYAASGRMLELHLASNAGNEAGLPLPGGFVVSPIITINDVTIFDPAHQIINQPNLITDPMLDGWNWSSHGIFTTMPAGAHVIITNTSDGQPVCAEASVGGGTILATLQTVEWFGASLPYLENLVLYQGARAAWLSVSPDSGQVSNGDTTSVSVLFNAANLLCGEFFADLVITSNDPLRDTVRVPVHIHIASPEIVSAPDTLQISVTEESPATEAIQIKNIGEGPLTFNITDDQPWLSEAPDSGSVAVSDSISINVTADGAQLIPGNYSATLTITSNDCDETEVLVPVQIHVGPDPDIAVSPDSFYAIVAVGDSNVSPLAIANAGSGTLSFKISPKADSQTTAISRIPDFLTVLRANEEFARAQAGKRGEVRPGVSIVVPDITRTAEEVYTASRRFGVKATSMVRVAVVDSYGADYKAAAWDYLNANWGLFGTTQVVIDYSSLNKEGITYADLVASGADVLVISDAWSVGFGWEFTPSELTAIRQYIGEGHGAVATSGTFDSFDAPANPVGLAALFGVDSTAFFNWAVTQDRMNIVVPTHPVVNNVTNPYIFGYNFSCAPASNDWTTAITTGQAVGLSAAPATGSIIVHPSHRVYISNIPEENSNSDNYRVLYNSMVWVSAPTWLTAAPDSGLVAPGNTDSVQVTMNAKNLTVGHYYGHLEIRANDPDESTTSIPAHLRVGKPELAFDCDTISVSGLENETTQVCCTLSDTGDVALRYLITDNQPWLWVIPDSGSVGAGSSIPICVTIDGYQLLPGNYTALLTIRSNDRTDSLRLIPVFVHIGPDPDILVATDSIKKVVSFFDIDTIPIVVKNTGAGTLGIQTSSQGGMLLATGNSKENQRRSSLAGGKPGSAILSYGGPDTFGHRWIDSDEPNGPAFNWIEISSIGVLVSGLGNDGTAGPFNIGFVFPFYGLNATQIRINANGFVTFTAPSTGTALNQPLPSSLAPQNLIAPFWDDLTLTTGGQVYRYSDGTKFIVEYKNVPRNGGGGVYSFEVILYPDGKIIYQYQSLNGPVNSATVGIQNQTRTDGLQIVFNDYYLHDNLAIAILTGSPFTVTPGSAIIPPGDSEMVNIIIDADSLVTGMYRLRVDIFSNDPDEPLLSIPVRLQIGRGDIDQNNRIDMVDIILMVNYVFYGGPAPDPLELGDMNCDGVVDINDIICLINFVYLGGPPDCCP